MVGKLTILTLNYLYAVNMSYRPQRGVFYSDIIEYFYSIIPNMEMKHNYIYYKLTHKIMPILCKMGLVRRMRTTYPMIFVVDELVMRE